MKKIATIILSAFFIASLAAAFSLFTKDSPSAQAVAPLTAAEVVTHNQASDCWIIISGKVYNVTAYIPFHPGGNAIVSSCGTDATAAFTGGSHQHSANATAMLANYLLGDLVVETPTPTPTPSDSPTPTPSQSPSPSPSPSESPSPSPSQSPSPSPSPSQSPSPSPSPSQSPSPSPSPSPSFDPSCIQTAIEKRDNAMIAAWDANASSTRAALETRKNALKDAWSLSDKKLRKKAINNAWKNYKKSIQQSRKTLKKAQQAAWNAYRADVRACGKPFTLEDQWRSRSDDDLD